MSDNNTKGGLGLGGILFVVFLILKLCKVITWSWVWVLSPLWIPFAIGLIIIIIALIIGRK